MENLNKQIENIIQEQLDFLNEKIKGINFLESLKYKLIDKVKPLIENYTFIQKDDCLHKLEANFGEMNIIANIIFIKKPSSFLKKKLINDTLLISLKEIIKIDVFKPENNKEFVNFSILPYMGVCLPEKTIVNFNFLPNSHYLEIICVDKAKDIENSKNNII